MISSGLCFLLGIQCPFCGPDYHSFWAAQRGQIDPDFGSRSALTGFLKHPPTCSNLIRPDATSDLRLRDVETIIRCGVADPPPDEGRLLEISPIRTGSEMKPDSCANAHAAEAAQRKQRRDAAEKCRRSTEV